MGKFLFVHFTGEHKNGEQIYFSVSPDGRHFHDLNDGQPILHSTIGEEGIRDPFLIRDEVNQCFYLIATDLQIHKGKGWQDAQINGSHNIVVWQSQDLIYWSEPHFLDVGLEEAGNVWAPEAIYDKEKKAFLVFWASKTNGKQKMYAAYTKDFKSLGTPFLFMEKKGDVIDSTILEANGYYYRFTKDETTSFVIMERAQELTGVYERVTSDTLAAIEGVEGPEIYQVDEHCWYLILDRFMQDLGYMILQTDDLGTQDFKILPETAYDFGQTKKRHGGVLAITDAEYDRLWQYYHQENPVIDGLFADPDLVKFNDTYYLYPTTDGVKNWGGKQFSVFCSKDLKHFESAGKILDLGTDQVPWATGNAWAPCILEKNGKYYYYFCGKRPDGNSCIGVATSNHPTGPFIADKTPLLPYEWIQKANLPMSQMIDPSVYQEDGKAYLLFGNGQTAAIVELTEDCCHIKPETFHAYEGLFEFREALTVFKRNDLYHFTWSCEDTGSENYHVNYGVSKKLIGPVDFHYTILEKQPERDILGTGHHSIFKEPDSENYKICYHRFATPLENYAANEKGFNRQVCISPLDFDEKGLIRPVII
ncbi:MAG TPA: family 43 glycosylhydrolase [Candidatus Tetragenococcus pullicola]|nr:family 43 glycosylhydrolase [Candidatus Tetragenococcus pullicola]